MNDMENVQDSPSRSAGRTIARNTAVGGLSQLLLRVISFLFQLLVVNTLGGEQFGQYSIVLGWAGLFSVLGDVGVTQYFAREVARDRNETARYFWDVVTLRLILAVVASVVTTAGAIAYGYSTEIVIATLLYTVSYFLQAFLAPLLSIITGNERVDIASLFEVVGQVIFMVAGALFLFAGKDFLWLVIAAFFNLPILILLAIWIVRRNNFGPPRFHINPRMWWNLLISGLPFGLIQLSLSFAFRVDTVILSGHVPDEHVGWYNAAYNLTLTLLTLSRTFNTAVLPTLAREHTHNPDTVRIWYFTSVKVLLFISLPIAVGGMVMAYSITDLLYRPELIPAFIPLSILVWDIPFVMYHTFCGNITQSIKRERSAAFVYGSLGVINFILNMIFIPRLGIVGAAFVTVLTDMVGAIGYYLLLRGAFGPGLGFKRIFRLGIAALIMGIIAYFIQFWNLLIVIAISGVVYLGIVWLTDVFTLAERQNMIALVQRVLRAVSRRLRPSTA
jgi:O-antigen/teichoic acid export membrane protein